jgi:hypothetical protein
VRFLTQDFLASRRVARSSSRSAQNFFMRSDSCRLESFLCAMVTCVFERAFETRYTSTDVPSSQVMRMDLLGTDARMATLFGNHAVRSFVCLNDLKTVLAPAAIVLLFEASHAPVRRWPISHRPLIRS